MRRLPEFTSDGVLPEGDHEATLADLREFVRGSDWSVAGRTHRLGLLDNLEIIVNQLYAVGLKDIWIDGSFVEAKDMPGDIDGYVDIGTRNVLDVLQALSARTAEEVWSLETYPVAGSTQPKSLLWHRYRIDLFLLNVAGTATLPAEYLKGTVLGKFRTSRRGMNKGIVKLVRRAK